LPERELFDLGQWIRVGVPARRRLGRAGQPALDGFGVLALFFGELFGQGADGVVLAFSAMLR